MPNFVIYIFPFLLRNFDVSTLLLIKVTLREKRMIRCYCLDDSKDYVMLADSTCPCHVYIVTNRCGLPAQGRRLASWYKFATKYHYDPVLSTSHVQLITLHNMLKAMR